MGKHSDYGVARECRREKHGGGGCLVPAIIILGSLGLWTGAMGTAIWMFA